jgi:hypothetical protein
MTDDPLLKKRRVIYMDHDSWEDTKNKARLHGLSISEYIRQILVGPVKATPIAELTIDLPADEPIKGGGIVTPPSFASRPFTPVPKKRPKA